MKIRKIIIFALVIVLSVAVLASCSRRPAENPDDTDPTAPSTPVDSDKNPDAHDPASTWDEIKDQEDKPVYVDDPSNDVEEDVTGIVPPDDTTSGNLDEYLSGNKPEQDPAPQFVYTVGVITSVDGKKLATEVYESKSGTVLDSYEKIDAADYEKSGDKQEVSIKSDTPVYHYDGSMWKPKSISDLKAGQMVIVVEAADGKLDSIILAAE